MKSEDLEIVVQDALAPAETHALQDVLEEHNLDQSGLRRTLLAITLRDGAGDIVGGVSGTMAWGLLYIQTIVVWPQFQGRGYGAKLLAAAEREAINRGCVLAHLHTMSFQAPTFYEKRGYSVFEVLQGVPSDYKRYLLKKTLR